MRLEMRQSTSVPASGWHLFSKGPTTVKPILPTEMWPSVIDTSAQHLRTLFVPFATAIRHSGGEHYRYLANQKRFILSSDVTSLPFLAVEVAREVLPLPVHLLPNTAEMYNEGRMQDETDLVSDTSYTDH